MKQSDDLLRIYLVTNSKDLYSELFSWLGSLFQLKQISTGAKVKHIPQGRQLLTGSTQLETNNIVILDMSLDDVDAIQLLDWLNQRDNAPKSIGIFDQISEEQENHCLSMGTHSFVKKSRNVYEPEFFLKLYASIVDLIEKDPSPPMQPERNTAIASAPLKGNLEDLGVTDLVTVLSNKNSSVVLNIISDLGEGTLWLSEGKIIGCKFAEMEGELAARYMCLPQKGTIYTSREKCPNPLPHALDAETVLLEAARLFDERVSSGPAAANTQLIEDDLHHEEEDSITLRKVKEADGNGNLQEFSEILFSQTRTMTKRLKLSDLPADILETNQDTGLAKIKTNLKGCNWMLHDNKTAKVLHAEGFEETDSINDLIDFLKFQTESIRLNSDHKVLSICSDDDFYKMAYLPTEHSSFLAHAPLNSSSLDKPQELIPYLEQPQLTAGSDLHD